MTKRETLAALEAGLILNPANVCPTCSKPKRKEAAHCIACTRGLQEDAKR